MNVKSIESKSLTSVTRKVFKFDRNRLDFVFFSLFGFCDDALF